jgi:hypothetical protein
MRSPIWWAFPPSLTVISGLQDDSGAWSTMRLRSSRSSDGTLRRRVRRAVTVLDEFVLILAATLSRDHQRSAVGAFRSGRTLGVLS